MAEGELVVELDIDVGVQQETTGGEEPPPEQAAAEPTERQEQQEAEPPAAPQSEQEEGKEEEKEEGGGEGEGTGEQQVEASPPPQQEEGEGGEAEQKEAEGEGEGEGEVQKDEAGEQEEEEEEKEFVLCHDDNPFWLSTEAVLEKGVPEAEVEKFKLYYYQEAFHLRNWYDRLKDYTMETEFITLSSDEIDVILAASHPNQTERPELSEEQQEVLTKLQNRIDDAIKSYGGDGAMVMFGTRPPYDAIESCSDAQFINEIRDAVNNTIEVENQSYKAYLIWKEQEKEGPHREGLIRRGIDSIRRSIRRRPRRNTGDEKPQLQEEGEQKEEGEGEKKEEGEGEQKEEGEGEQKEEGEGEKKEEGEGAEQAEARGEGEGQTVTVEATVEEEEKKEESEQEQQQEAEQPPQQAEQQEAEQPPQQAEQQEAEQPPQQAEQQEAEQPPQQEAEPQPEEPQQAEQEVTPAQEEGKEEGGDVQTEEQKDDKEEGEKKEEGEGEIQEVEEEEEKEEEPKKKPAPKSTKKVHVPKEAMDNRILRGFSRAMLEKLRVTNGEEAIDLLLRSGTAQQDLAQFKAFGVVEGLQFTGSVRRWLPDLPIHHGMMLRGFIYKNELHALSQSNVKIFYPSVVEWAQTIQEKVQELFTEHVKEALSGFESYIIDLLVTPDKVHILNLQPFDTSVDAGLFTWKEHGKFFLNGPFQFAIVEVPKTSPECYSHLPSFWQEMLQNLLQQKTPHRGRGCLLL